MPRICWRQVADWSILMQHPFKEGDWSISRAHGLKVIKLQIWNSPTPFTLQTCVTHYPLQFSLYNPCFIDEKIRSKCPIEGHLANTIHRKLRLKINVISFQNLLSSIYFIMFLPHFVSSSGHFLCKVLLWGAWGKPCYGTIRALRARLYVSHFLLSIPAWYPIPTLLTACTR